MVEDKPRFVEDVAKNASEKSADNHLKHDETTLNSAKMQHHGDDVRPSINETAMETAVSPKRESIITDFPHNMSANSLEPIVDRHTDDKNTTEAEISLKNRPELPETATSNHEYISLDSKDSREILINSDPENFEEKAANKINPHKENTEEINPFSHGSLIIENEKSSSKVEKMNNFEDTSHALKNSTNLSLQDNSWENPQKNCEEASIEDCCETPAFSHSKSPEKLLNMSPNIKPQNNSLNRTSTLSEDSRLVKIPLPTSSMNIMHSNAQFLNKSRNFLNFITEKSTNIMEKTLLPQNIAVRYNSLLKLSDGGYAVEKKHSEESVTKTETSADFTVNSDHESTDESQMASKIAENNVDTIDLRNENSANAQSAENSPRIVADTLNDFSTNSQLSASIINFYSPKSDFFSPANNEIANISYLNYEEIPETRSKSSEDEEVDEGMKKFLADDPAENGIVLIDSTNGLLRNPVYLTLVRDYAKAREEKLKLANRVKYLEDKNRMLEAQNSSELFNAQLETLEKTVEKLSGDLRLANANQDELGREFATANKERESMVMKYAVSEKQLIDTQRARDYAERRYKEIAKDHELLQNKLRQAQSERTRICNILDTKCRELTDAQKEVERLKEDVNVRDVKLKWTQNKLKTEMEAQKETQQKLDKATARINDMKEECEQVRRESQEMIRKFQQSEENKAVTLDHQLKEQQARLIVERHVTEDKEMLRIQLQKEVDLLKKRQQALIEENNTLSLKIHDLEKDRLAYESKFSDLKIVTDQRQKEIVDLSAKISHLETLKLQLIHKEQCLASNEAEVERLRQVNQELQADMDCCRQREAHMLDFTQKLTDKNVRLQSEFTAVEAKASQLEQEQGPLREGITELRAKMKTLEEHLAHEKKKRMEECEILARHLAEQTQLAQNLSQKLEDSQGEIAVLRRKQQISVKEMSRELQQCRKRLEAYESASPSNSLDPTSRTGSNTSLNTGETLNGITSDHSGNGEHALQSAELDRQSLIERILKMQKINVRRAEKLDFLEEHTRTLVAELQKKTKIIQNYILHENFDAMGSNERDRHKAELARHGGIMASVYNHRVSDDNMTLELSLEINQKLQAVLEDALLKNITLKDNIDTLGEEIARLTIKNQQMLQQKSK